MTVTLISPILYPELTVIAALERTFLGHIRTSLALAFVSVIISQSYTLSPTLPTPDKFGILRAGKSLSSLFIMWAMVVALVGAVRTFRIQSLLLQGRTVAGGWDLVVEGAGIAVVSNDKELDGAWR